MRKGFFGAIAIVVAVGLLGCSNPASPSPKQFTVTYNGNGSTAGSVPEAQKKTQGTALTVASNSGALVREGFTFNGWNTAGDGSGVAYASGSTYSVDADMTLYANWKESGSEYSSSNIGTLIYIPSGSFRRDSKVTNVSVIANGYRMSRYEITRKQFSAIMGTDPTNPSKSTGDSDPVMQVKWYQAIAFCNKLSIAEKLQPVYTVTVSGSPVDFSNLSFAAIPTAENADWDAVAVDWSANGYRLPTEMEWQWAAMGAADDYTKKFAGSNGSNAINDFVVWGYPNGGNVLSTKMSSPVGSKKPNELGLYDMSGNAYEWCWDWWALSYPSGSISSGTAAGRGAATGKYRIIRGGYWSGSATACAVAERMYYTPTTSADYTGFRVVRN